MLNLHCFIVAADDKDIFSLNVWSACCKLASFDERNFLNWLDKKQKLIKLFIKETYASCYLI